MPTEPPAPGWSVPWSLHRDSSDTHADGRSLSVRRTKHCSTSFQAASSSAQRAAPQAQTDRLMRFAKYAATGGVGAGAMSAAPGAGGKPIHEWLEVRPFL